MKGVALTPRAMAVATALSLILLSATQCSTAFVLRASSLSRALVHDGERSTTAPSAAAVSANARRPRAGLLGLSPNALQPSKRRRDGGRLMMVAEPAEEDEGVAEEAAATAAADKPPVPEDEGVVAVEGQGEAAPLEDGEEAAGDGETEVVVEGEEGEEGKEEEEEEEEEEEVDPMAEVKQQIQDLEKELLAEENKLRDAQDSIQEKGQMGFLRMAAQVDNFRKTSGLGTGDYEADAKAAVLKAMLPAFEPFEAAKDALKTETENEVKFNNSYQALYRQLKDVYTKIGATDFFGVVGEKFVYSRHEKASEEHNPIMKEGMIIKCISPGVELKKNVIRKAVVVVSLGPEKKEEEKAGDKDDGEEGAPAAAASAAAAAGEAEGGEPGGSAGSEWAEAGAETPPGEGEEAAAA
eukprot:g15130.t1